jgi:hypothetical protein
VVIFDRRAFHKPANFGNSAGERADKKSSRTIMRNEYKIRMFESADGERVTTSGTIVRAIDRSFFVQANEAAEVEEQIRQEVVKGALPAGRVYEIHVPAASGAESASCVVIHGNGKMERVFLDAASGIYFGFRRLRRGEDVAQVGQEPAAVSA